MKNTTLVGTIAGAALVLGGIGVGAAIATQDPEPTPTATVSESPAPEAPALEEPMVVETPAPVPTTTSPLVAQAPSGDRDEAAFLAFVHMRQATFPTQIPDATDADLIATGDIACARITEGQAQGQTDAQVIDGLSLIEGEVPSDLGGYYYDSSAIIAGAQIHLCPETIDYVTR